MKRMIKFDLPIDGVKVATLDDLRDHFTTEILQHFHSGVLAKWLRSRDLEKELHEVEHLIERDIKGDAPVLKALCHIFDIAADDAVIEAAVGEKTETRGLLLGEKTETRDPLLTEQLFSKEISSWWIWLIYVLVDLEIVETYSSPNTTGFPKPRMLRHMHKDLVKQDWDKYLRRRIVLWSVVAGFLRKCPANYLSGEFVEQVESNISNCISCYDLSKDDHDFVLDALLTALSHDCYVPHSVNYHSYSELFNANHMYEEANVLSSIIRSVTIGGDRARTLSLEDINKFGQEKRKLQRASKLLNKAFSQIRKSEFVAAVEKLRFLDLNLMVR